MHDLAPLTPLGESAPRIDIFDGLRIAESPDRSLVSVAARAGRADAVREAAAEVLGIPLPAAGRLATSTSFAAFWTGPDQWMIDAPPDGHEDLAARVEAALGDAASVTEQSDAWARFDLGGPRCHDVLERLCAADTRTMTGAAVRTRIEHVNCVVLAHEDGTFSILGPRSSAGSLHHALATTAASVL